MNNNSNNHNKKKQIMIKKKRTKYIYILTFSEQCMIIFCLLLEKLQVIRVLLKVFFCSWNIIVARCDVLYIHLCTFHKQPFSFKGLTFSQTETEYLFCFSIKPQDSYISIYFSRYVPLFMDSTSLVCWKAGKKNKNLWYWISPK